MKRHAGIPLVLAIGFIIILGFGLFFNTKRGTATILLEEEDSDTTVDEEDFDFGADFDLQTLIDHIELGPDESLLKCRVFDADGKPVSLAKVKLQDTTESYQSLTDADGNCYILNISPGTYTAIVSPPPLALQMNITPPQPEKITFTGGKKTVKDFAFLAGKEGTKTIQGSVMQNGQPVANAKILALRNNPFALVEKNTDASGQFHFSVTGGTWIVTASSINKDRSKNIVIAKFGQDETPESTLADFVIAVQDATITGIVKNPDGSAPKKGTLVNLSNTQQYSTEVRADGSFSVAVAGGVYNVSVVSADANTSAPDPVQVTVGNGQTFDVGVITLVRDTGRLNCKVKDAKTGKGVSNVVVNVSDIGGANFQSAKTGNDGSCSITVSSGDYLVSIETPTTKYTTDKNNIIATISGKETKTVDFDLQPQPTKISGSLVNEKGKFVNDADGYVLVTNEAGESFGGDISNGSYSFNLSDGTYSACAVLAPDAPYAPSNCVSLTIGEDESAKQFNIKVDTNKYKICGNIVDEQGKRVSGVKVRVFASDSDGTWQQDEQTDGSYCVNVSQGPWNMGSTVIDSDDYLPVDTAVTVDVKRGDVTKNIVVKRASSTIIGSVKDPQGNGLAHVYVSVDGTSTDPDNKDTGKTFVTSVETDNDGNFSASVTKGTYYLHAYQQTRRDLVSPGEVAVTINAGQTLNVAFAFQNAEVTVSGHVTTPEGKALTQAVVSAWSEHGGFAQTIIDPLTKTFKLKVSPDTWHITGSADSGGNGYESSSNEVVAEGGQNYTLDIVTIPTAVKLHPPVSQVIAGAVSALEIKDGVSVMLPHPADMKGKLILSMNETVETRDQGRANVVGVGYNISLRDSKGSPITELGQPMVLTFPFNKDELKAIGAKPENLVPCYWDESVGAYKKLENVVIDAKKGVITATSRHLTRFALVAPADETPPPAPTAIALASKNNAIVLSWKIAKVSDYHHSKIYRSDKAGVLGTVVADNITKNTAEIKGDGKYLYVVRSVDLAGNESTNKDQVSLSKSKVPKVPKPK